MAFKKYAKNEFGQPNKFYAYYSNAMNIFLTTVKTREARFTRDEVRRSKGVRELKMRLGGASDRDLVSFITSGVAVGCPYTPEDVRRATLIYGPDIASLKGKTTDSGPMRATIIDLDNIGEKKVQSLFVDIF